MYEMSQNHKSKAGDIYNIYLVKCAMITEVIKNVNF